MPTPYVSPRSTSSTSSASANTINDPFGATLAKALQYGLVGGAALGALYGTLLLPVIGTILGVIFGAALGLIGGLANGIVIGLLTGACFTPLTNARRYGRAVRIVALLTTGVTALITYRLLQIPFGVNGREFMTTLPALFALGFAWYAAGRGSRWYVAAVGLQPLTIPDPNTAQMYDSAFLQRLFDDMQDTYELVCNICSFGFGRRWRRQLIDLLHLRPGMRVLDLMSGTGETWMTILPRIGANGRLIAVDFAPAMLARARARRDALADLPIVVLDEDALRLSLPTAAADAVVCAYGVKTLSPVDQERFVGEIVRVLRPGGCFGIVEITPPPYRLLRWPYLWYLSYVVPVVGAIFLGNPDSYRMLSRYVAEFQNADHLCDALRKQGCTVHRYPLFGGCATALVGITPGA